MQQKKFKLRTIIFTTRLKFGITHHKILFLQNTVKEKQQQQQQQQQQHSRPHQNDETCRKIAKKS